jgi:hypothetical protein
MLGKKYVRNHYSQSSFYPFFKTVYHLLVDPIFDLLKYVATCILKLFNISLVVNRYAILDESKFERHFLLRGFNGITYIGKTYFLSKGVSRKNFRKDANVIQLTSNIRNHVGEPVIPVSVLESSLLTYGNYQVSRPSASLDFSATHALNLDLNGTLPGISVPAEQSFFHFYIQVVPFILRHYLEYPIYLNLDSNSFHEDVLHCMGVNPTPMNIKIKYTDTASQIGHYPSASETTFLRNHLETLGYKREPLQNIYITRRGNRNGRHVQNELELLKILKKYNFSVVNPSELSFKDQLSLFSKANIVVGPHGAALSHVVNFPNETRVLELNGDRDIRWHIRTMCRDLNISHNILLGKSLQNNNFEINIDLIEQFLAKNL